MGCAGFSLVATSAMEWASPGVGRGTWLVRRTGRAWVLLALSAAAAVPNKYSRPAARGEAGQLRGLPRGVLCGGLPRIQAPPETHRIAPVPCHRKGGL